MAKEILNSHLGKVYLLETNPRQIRESAFNTLCESIERDPEFLRLRQIIVWQVPTRLELGEGEKSPFSGQLGRLVILGGNQRARALKALGYNEIRPEWLVEAKDAQGNWISPEAAERLVLIDNGSAGIAGYNDYERLLESFREETMRMSGIDFSEFEGLIKAGTATVNPMDETDEEGKTAEDRAEEDSLYGEKSADLEAFIAEREKTRKALKEIDEAGFYLLLVFEEGFVEKAEFISKAKVFGGTVAVDQSPYMCLVFETYDQKRDFLDRSGLRDVVTEDGLPALMYGMFCDGRAFASKMGIELARSGLHFRDRIVDNQLKEMALEPMEQKGEREIETEIYERLKAERAALGMEVGGEKSKVKGGRRAKK